MTDWLVCDGEFAEVVASHFWTDFDLVKRLTVVNPDDLKKGKEEGREGKGR